MTDGKTSSAVAAVAVSACLWGFLGYFSRNLSEMGLSSVQVSFIRMSVGLIVLTLGLLIFDRKCFRIRKKDLWIFVFFGIFKILSDVLLFGAQIRIHLSLSTALQMTSPYWALLFSVFLFSEKITKKKAFAVCLAFFGCLLVVGLLQDNIDFDSLGAIFALLSGVAFATYTVGNKVLMDRGYSANTVIFYVFLISTVICVPFSDVREIPGMVRDMGDVWNILAMGVLMTLVPYYLQIYAVKYIAPVTAQVIGLLEVAAAVNVGFLLYGESIGLINVLGMGMISLSVVVLNVNPGQRTAKPRTG